MRREKNRLKIKNILVISLNQKFEDFLDEFENYYFFLEIFPAKNTIFDFDDRIKYLISINYNQSISEKKIFEPSSSSSKWAKKYTFKIS